MMSAQNRNAENSYPIGAELTNEVFILTKTLFAASRQLAASNKKKNHRGNSENTP
jgi:hypothetical protein